ncbi:MAG: hypothetical protein C4K49_01070 [Candidatus Thorarchaeota archaeon]|nr:MAG: hypothetical protein C4K49_01070 [Candidatus Thorarchaeota archaeon]
MLDAVGYHFLFATLDEAAPTGHDRKRNRVAALLDMSACLQILSHVYSLVKRSDTQENPRS